MSFRVQICPEPRRVPPSPSGPSGTPLFSALSAVSSQLSAWCSRVTNSRLPFTLSPEGPRHSALSRAVSFFPFRLFDLQPFDFFPAFRLLPCPLGILCFQSLPTIKFSNHFLLITIRIAGGGRTPLTLSCNDRCKFAPLFSITSRMLLSQPLSLQTFALLPGGGTYPCSKNTPQNPQNGHAFQDPRKS